MRRWQAIPVGVLAPALVAMAAFAAWFSSGAQPDKARAGIAGMPVFLDCDLSTGGIQGSCSYPSGTTTIQIGVVISNTTGSDSSIGSLNFTVRAEQNNFDPPVGSITDSLNSNPDYTLAAEGSTSFTCTPPSPDNDTNADPNIADSFLSCLTFSPDGPALPSGATAQMAVITYNALLSDVTGSFTFADLGAGTTSVSDNDLTEIAACPTNIADSVCTGATVTIGAGGQAATNTPIPPTATATATRTPCVGGTCPTKTPLAFVTVTPTGGPATATVAPGTTPPPSEPPPPGAQPTQPGGRPGGVISGPDTGTGGDAGGRNDGLLYAGLAALGLSLVSGGWYLRYARRSGAGRRDQEEG